MVGKFHITVGVSPDKTANLAGEIQLLKAALLYADSVTLCSPAASMLEVVSHFVYLKGYDQRLNFCLQHAREIGFPREKILQFINIHRQLKRQGYRTPDRQAFARDFYHQLDVTWQEIGKTYDELLERAGAPGIKSAIKTGIVTLHPLKGISINTGLGLAARSALDEVVQDYWQVIQQAILSGNTYPLFDDLTGELIQYAVREGKFVPSEPRIARSKHIGLSGQVLQQLPLFAEATIDEVIDIRKELESPLIRFRSAMMEYSATIESAAWDADFPLEADHLFRQKIEPVVLEIKEEVKANSYLKQVGQRVLSSRVFLPSSIPATLGVIISKISNLEDLLHLAMLGLSVAGTDLLRNMLDAQKTWQEKKQEIERKQLYFLYKAEEMLSE